MLGTIKADLEQSSKPTGNKKVDNRTKSKLKLNKMINQKQSTNHQIE